MSHFFAVIVDSFICKSFILKCSKNSIVHSDNRDVNDVNMIPSTVPSPNVQLKYRDQNDVNMIPSSVPSPNVQLKYREQNDANMCIEQYKPLVMDTSNTG